MSEIVLADRCNSEGDNALVLDLPPSHYSPQFFVTKESQPIRQLFDAKERDPEQFANRMQESLSVFDVKGGLSRDFRYLAELALDRYPDYPYHQAAHGLEVIKNTHTLLRQVNSTTEERQAMYLAAAMHDVDFTHNNSPQADWRQYPDNKEGLSAHVFRTLVRRYGVRINFDDAKLIRQAILGTVMTPGTTHRNNKWGCLMHHADVGYLWGDSETFLNFAMRFRIEECGQMTWLEFKRLEETFLTGYMNSMQHDLLRWGVSEDWVADRVVQVKNNIQLITTMDTEPDIETYADWPW